MTIFPNAKINIGLWITSKRDDGFHNIESIFYPLDIKDACEFVMQEDGLDSDEFTQTGIQSDCAMQDNLVIRSVNLIRERYNIPALKVHLHKAIPLGAGLGGGSSDASFMLKYLNRYFRLGLCNNDLKKMALELGSDCPFFIQNIPAHATGRGELLSKVSPLKEGYKLLVLNPGIHIDTAVAYSKVIPIVRSTSLSELYKLPLEDWKDSIVNDFEPYIFESHPEIAEIKNELYRQGAMYSSMSGSGSSVYGIFRNDAPIINYSGYWSWLGKL